MSESKVFVHLLLQELQDEESVRGRLDEGEGISKDDLERLTNRLREAGLDAQISNEEAAGGEYEEYDEEPENCKEDLERLAADISRGEGLDAQISNEEFQYSADSFSVGGVVVPRKGAYSTPTISVPLSVGIPEIICIWFAQGAVGALGGATALATLKWMKDRFLRKKDEGQRGRTTAMLIEHNGEKGLLRGTVELDGARSKPVVRATGRKRVTVEKPDDVRWL